MGWEGHELHGGFHVHLGFAARAHETLRFQAHHHPIPADWNCGVQDWWTCHWNMSGSIKLALKWSTGDVWAAQRCDIWPSSGYHWRLSPPVQQGFNKANLAKKTKKQQNHPGLVFTDTLQMFTTRCKQQMWDHQFWLVCGDQQICSSGITIPISNQNGGSPTGWWFETNQNRVMSHGDNIIQGRGWKRFNRAQINCMDICIQLKPSVATLVAHGLVFPLIT